MMACKRRSDNLSLVKYGHSEIIRAERATRRNTTLAQAEETGREKTVTLALSRRPYR